MRRYEETVAGYLKCLACGAYLDPRSKGIRTAHARSCQSDMQRQIERTERIAEDMSYDHRSK